MTISVGERVPAATFRMMTPDGATLTLTAVSGEQAIEVPYRLD